MASLKPAKPLGASDTPPAVGTRLPLLDALPAKLLEADFFLERLEKETDPAAATFFFSAFCTAARSVTFVIQATMSHLAGFDEWYAPHQTRFKDDPLARMMVEQRNLIQKTGEGGITGGGIRARTKEVTFRFDDLMLSDYGIDPRANDVVALSKKHMGNLAIVVDDCLRHFKPIADPCTYITVPWLRERGMTPEDLEEKLGFPRGWTEVEGGEDEWEDRVRLLLAQVPAWPDVSAILEGRSTLHERNRPAPP